MPRGPRALAVQADLRQAAVNAVAHCIGVKAHVEGAESHVLLDGWHEDLVVRVLEKHADPLPDTREAGGADLHAADRHASFAAEQSDQMVQERRLTRAVRPQHGHGLARAQNEAHVPQRFDTVRIVERQVAHVDEQLGHFKPIVWSPAAGGHGRARPLRLRGAATLWIR